MRRFFLGMLLFLCTGLLWAYGYRLTIESTQTYELYFTGEDVLNETTEGRQYPAGIQELVFHEDAEYLVLLLNLPTPGMIRVDLVFLDAQDLPLGGKPIRFILDGTFGGMRVKHPSWIGLGV